MNHRFPLQAFLLVLLLVPAINAQETTQKVVELPAATATAAVPATKSKPTSAAAKAKLEQQRSLALSLLVSLANDARSFRDQKLRTRTMARVADGIWDADAAQGRSLFLKAWDAAEVADQDAAREMKEEKQRQETHGHPAERQRVSKLEFMRPKNLPPPEANSR